MRRIIAIIVLVVIGKILFSQQVFNFRYTIPNSSSIPITIIPTDSGYIISAFSPPTIYFIDLNNNIKWGKQWSFDLPAGIGTLTKTTDNYYIATGNMQYNGVIEKNMFLKFNYNFDTVYSKIYNVDSSSSTSPFLWDSFENESNNYLLIGENTKDSLGNPFSNNYSKGWVLIVDPLGNVINSKTIGSNSNYNRFNSGLQIGNNYYFIGGTRSYAPIQVTGFDRIDAWIVKTDMQGNEIAFNYYGNPILMDGEFNVCRVVEQNKIGVIYKKALYKYASGWIKYIYKTGLLVLNEDLSINKEIFFKEEYKLADTIYMTEIENFHITPDSSFIFYGIQGPINVNSQIGNKKGLVIKTNKRYKVEYFRNYEYLQQGTPQSLGVLFNTGNYTSDGGNIFGGLASDLNFSQDSSWLVKTDSLGCDGFTSCNDTAMVVQILNHPDTLCKDSTYSIAVRLKGRSAPYRLYANGTLTLDSIYYPYTLPLWIDTIMPVVLHDTGWQNLSVTLHEPWERTASDTVQVYVSNCPTTSNMTDFYKRKVEIFPNPATTELHVKIRGVIDGNYSITMYDTQGKTVDRITIKEQETVIDISKYRQGVYWVRVLGNNIVRSEKVIILKND